MNRRNSPQFAGANKTRARIAAEATWPRGGNEGVLNGMSTLRVLFWGAAAATALLGQAAAQDPEETARESVEQQRRALESVESAKESAAGGTIQIEDVLNAPEDVQLNLSYAQERIAAGDLKEAAAALERVLLVSPSFYSARVLYGLVLYRLQMYDRARFELEKALEGELPATVRAEAEAYLSRIKRAQRRTRGSLTLTTGFEYDENRTQTPSSGQVLFMDIPLPAGPQEADFAWVNSVQGRLYHDLGKQNGAAIFGEVAYFRSDKAEVDRLDLDAVTAAVGATWNWGNLSVTPSARGAVFWLEESNYLQTIGGELELLWRMQPDFRTYIVFRGDDEDFDGVPSFMAADLRSGRRLSARAGFNWNMNPTMTMTVEGLAMDKQADAAFEAYERFGAFAQHAWLHGGGAFTLVGLWAEHSGYDAADAFVSASVRDEWLYRARFTAGAPLSWFVPGVDLPRLVKDINLIAQYEYERVDSNILNFDYDTHKVNVLLSKRFAF